MSTVKKFSQFILESGLRRAAGLAIVWQGKVLLAHTTGRKASGGWGIPKGGVEPGESSLAAAIREVVEETGIRVDRGQVEPTSHQFIVNSGHGGKLVEYYIVHIQSLEEIGLKGERVPRGWLQLDEVDQAQFMDFRQASRTIMASQRPLLMNLQHLGLIG